jgi:hypothetical protein
MQAVFAIRIRLHSTSKYSPFFLLFGVDPRLPGDPNIETPPLNEDPDINSDLNL